MTRPMMIAALSVIPLALAVAALRAEGPAPTQGSAPLAYVAAEVPAPTMEEIVVIAPRPVTDLARSAATVPQG